MATSEVGFSSSSGSSATGTISWVSGVASGDQAVLVIVKNVTADTIVTPTGFSVLSTKLIVGTTLQVNWFHKTLDGSESGTLALDFGGNGKWAAGMGVIRGSATPVVSATTAGDNSTDTSTDYPGYTPTAADAYAMAIGGIQAPTANSHTAPGVWTEKVEIYSTAADPNVGAYIAGRQLAGGPSAQGATVGTNTISVRDAIYIVTFPPGAAPDPIVVNAGADQTGREPFQLTTVTPSVSGGTPPYSYAYSFSGDPVTDTTPGTQANHTIKAPATSAGGSTTVTITVTDAVSATGSDSMVISATAHNYFLWDGAAYDAIEEQRVS